VYLVLIYAETSLSAFVTSAAYLYNYRIPKFNERFSMLCHFRVFTPNKAVYWVSTGRNRRMLCTFV